MMFFDTIKEEMYHSRKYIPFFIFSILVAGFLIILHLIKLSAFFPEESLVLVRNAQTLSAWFLSSYVHYDNMHLLANIGMWIICSAFIYMMAGIREKLQNPIPKYYFIEVLALILIVFPFILSLVNLTFTPFNKTMGFSGISFALGGVLVYLIISLISACETKIQKIIIYFSSLFITLMIFASSFITSPHDVMAINHLGHSVGFIYGLIVACICDSSLKKREQKRKGV